MRSEPDSDRRARRGIPTGQNTDPRDTVPQGTVKPGGAETPGGPRDWHDVIVHTGEARGLADTAYSSMEPDSPTVGAAQQGHDLDSDLSLKRNLPSSSNAPD
jgi:hypothetical protein